MFKKLISCSAMCLIVFGLVGCGNTNDNTEIIEVTEKIETIDNKENNNITVDNKEDNNIKVSKVTRKEEKNNKDEQEESSLKGTVLLDCDEVTITIDRLVDRTRDSDPWAGYYVTVENKTDKKIYIEDKTTVNGKDAKSISTITAEPNSIGEALLGFGNDNLKSIDDFCNIEVELTIREWSYPDYELFNIYNISIPRLNK